MDDHEVEANKLSPEEIYKQDRERIIRIKEMLEDNGFNSTFVEKSLFYPAYIGLSRLDSEMEVKIFLSDTLRASLVFETLKRP